MLSWCFFGLHGRPFGIRRRFVFPLACFTLLSFAGLIHQSPCFRQQQYLHPLWLNQPLIAVCTWSSRLELILSICLLPIHLLFLADQARIQPSRLLCCLFHNLTTTGKKFRRFLTWFSCIFGHTVIVRRLIDSDTHMLLSPRTYPKATTDAGTKVGTIPLPPRIDVFVDLVCLATAQIANIVLHLTFLFMLIPPFFLWLASSFASAVYAAYSFAVCAYLLTSVEIRLR
ncbi:unnamed protein product [Protopolystoma xenopodis]|uniref:Uncharacterized protein n=1 Tax=Protopolystoma xenopodis TaxID=117903 RepID=A0A3S5A377_9PLAT|nr:unnamed protein product [Protopolystoma xenopodis]